MITEDTSPIFPTCSTFGFTAEPNYLVKITAREGGFERRQRVWSRPLSKYTAVPLGNRSQSDIEDVLYFWHAMGGMSTAFRFEDQIDFKSSRLSVNPSYLDMPIVPTTDSPPRYQLVKQYVIGSITQEREIQRPKGDTIEIANGSGELQDESTYTLDESTGVLVPNGGFSGVPSFWGGEFYVWVRFDGQFNPAISDYKIQNATIQLTELRQPLA